MHFGQQFHHAIDFWNIFVYKRVVAVVGEGSVEVKALAVVAALVVESVGVHVRHPHDVDVGERRAPIVVGQNLSDEFAAKRLVAVDATDNHDGGVFGTLGGQIVAFINGAVFDRRVKRDAGQRSVLRNVGDGHDLLQPLVMGGAEQKGHKK